MTDIIRQDAATLAGKIAAKELSSTEITQAFLDQIAATDERYGAFLHVAGDAALSAAAAVDKALAAGERPPSPLAGVPLANEKVTVPVRGPPAVVFEGMLTVAVKLTGVPAFAGLVRDVTATAVVILAIVS